MPGHHLRQNAPMTKEQAQDWIRTLSIALKCSAPRLNWNPKEKNGHYSWGTIHVGPRTWRGLHCLLHEFAHHTTRYSPATAEQKMYGRGRRHHGENFYQALLEVVDAAERLFGHEYDWLTEYKTLRQRRLTDKVATQRRAAGCSQGPSLASGNGSKCGNCGRTIRPFEGRLALDPERTLFQHTPDCPPVKY